MPTNSKQSEVHVESINLKHRVTGAGVLIFFGALVLPWLLGPPSEAMKDRDDQVPQTVAQHSTFEDQVLAQLQGSEIAYEEPDETVYVSKITPVNGRQVVSEPEIVEKGLSAEEEKTAADLAAAASVSKEIDKLAKKEVLAKIDTKKAIGSIKSNNKTQGKTTEVSDSASKAGIKKVEAAKNIEIGWVVQVELLTDKKGAARLVKELSAKGFVPHTTIVDTNRGKRTGTRIWLGPFEQRSQAGAENDKLKASLGKGGFIRVYP